MLVNRNRKSVAERNNTDVLLTACSASASSEYWGDGEGLHQTCGAFPFFCKIKTVAKEQISGLGFYWLPRQPRGLTQVSEVCGKCVKGVPLPLTRTGPGIGWHTCHVTTENTGKWALGCNSFLGERPADSDDPSSISVLWLNRDLSLGYLQHWLYICIW